MKANIQAITITLFSLLAFPVKSQEALGPHPPDQKWQQLNSPAINIIFPKGMEFKAQRIANYINHMNENNKRSVGEKSVKTSIILQNRTVETNGFVGFVPFRSEFFSMPPQTFAYFGAVDFTNLLAIHEYRHVQQFSNSRRGLTKIAYWLQGELGWAALQNLSIPNWYYEGDAVIQETALTNGGRGRVANFSVYQRAINQQGKTYSYPKIRNGSFRDVVPDHYRWGYSMLSFLRNTYGNDTIKPIMHDAARYKKWFYPFSRSLKNYTGLTTKELYRYAIDDDSRIWDKRLKSRQITSAEILSPNQKNTPSFYHFPQYDKDGNLYAWKNSFKETDEIVQIRNDQEKVLVRPGIGFDKYFDQYEKQFVWTENRINPRRNKESYSDLVHYDLNSKEKKRLSSKGRYFSPRFTSEGKEIIAVEIKRNLIAKIVKINLETEDKSILMLANEGEFIARPILTQEGDELVFILQFNNQLAIFKYHIKEEKRTQLSPWTSHVIDAPSVHANYVYFSSDFDQIDNIYRVPLDGSQKIEQLSSSALGAYEPAVSKDGESLVYAESIFNGQRISGRKIDADFSLVNEIKEPVEQVWRDKVAAEAEGGSILNIESDSSYNIDEYSGFLKGLKLYAWPINPSNAAPSLGLNFINYLNDFAINLEGGYNRNEDSPFFNSEISYGKFYPIFSLLANNSYRETDYLSKGTDSIAVQSFRQKSFGLAVSVPLSWYAGNYLANLNTNISYQYFNISNREFDKTELAKRNFGFISTGYAFSFTRRTARQQVAPRLGISSSVDYHRNAAFLDDEKIFIQLRVFLPGVFKTHSLQFSGAFQKELLGNDFQLEDRFEYPRGYLSPINDEFVKLSVDYGLPLLYPDWGIWGLSYFKRIRMNLFADYGEGYINQFDLKLYYASVGAELIFDQVIWNILPVSLGLRGSSLLNKDPDNQNQGLVIDVFVASSF